MKLVSFASAITLGWVVAGCGPNADMSGSPNSTNSTGGAGFSGSNVTSGGFSGSFTETGGSAGSFGPLPVSVDAGIGTPISSLPFIEPLVVADTPPPPLSGGTLTVIASGHKAAVADPDHDQVVVVNLDDLTISATIALRPGDEPGRLVEDSAGRVHVSLRRSGELATLDPSAGAVLARRAVCANPRGLAYDAKIDSIHVACVEGDLVTLPAAGGAPTRQLKLEQDLRDVVIDGDRLLVSRFRAAELLVVEADGHVSAKLTPPGRKQPNVTQPTMAEFVPAVAWRTVAYPGGGALMVFQEEQTTEVRIAPGGYGGAGCGGVVQSSVALLGTDGAGWATLDIGVVLPVDVAVAPGGGAVSVARAGMVSPSSMLTTSDVSPAVTFSPIAQPQQDLPDGGTSAACLRRGGRGGGGAPPEGQGVAVAYGIDGQLIVQMRDPAMLVVGARSVALPGKDVTDTGHRLFHLATSGGLACASCHPEGHEDGHVWTFADLGSRRTQSIGGGLLGTEPFHWSGDMTDFATLSHEVLTSRMSGPTLGDDYDTALVNWIDKIPAWKHAPAADPAAVARGQALFNDRDVGCTSCHVGAKLTNNKTVDVGTGAPFQVPSLHGIAYRAPYMHQGCAKTLIDRFGNCGGGDLHGKTSSLTAAQRADLVSFLATL